MIFMRITPPQENSHSRFIIVMIALTLMTSIALACSGVALCSQAGDEHDPVNLGRRLIRIGKFGKAAELWNHSQIESVFKPVTYVLLGEAQLKAGQLADAEATLKEFLDTYKLSSYRGYVTELYAAALADQKKPEAAPLLADILNKSPGRDKPEIIFKIAELHRALGAYEEAEKHYRYLYLKHPASIEGLKASERISRLVFSQKINKPVYTETDKTARADRLFASGRFDLAAEDYQQLLKAKPRNKALLIKIAKCRFKERQNQHSLNALRILQKSDVSENDKLEGLFLESLIYWRLDKDKDFVSVSNKIVEKSNPKYKKRALYNLGGFYLEKRKFPEAEKAYRKFLTMQPDASSKADVYWKLAWIKYWKHDYSAAANLFKEARPTSHIGKIENASKYWQARSYIFIKKNKEAESLLREIVQSNPLNYYAGEAVRVLKTMGVNQVNGNIKKAFPDVTLSKEQSANPIISDAGKLLDKQLYEFAVMQLETLPKSMRANPPVAFLLAKAYYKAEKYTQAQETLRTAFGSLVDNPPDSAPPEFIEIAFPRIHLNYTIKTAEKHSVDPHLIWAIIRQESRYDASAVSPAGALGLMQVMPYSVGIGKKSGKTSTKVIEEILDPQKNLNHGIRILAKNLAAFHGQLAPAIASYNADIRKVRDWVKRGDKLSNDEFIESIPYFETRLYVKKVLAGYRAYSSLHRRKDLVGLW